MSLFMPAARPPDPDLARLLQQVQGALPSLRGEQGEAPPGELLRHGGVAGGAGVGSANGALQALCQHWARLHPEAGAHYVALRCWGLAIWQPVYLGVLAAHLARHVPRLAGLAQPVVSGFPRGFYLPAHAPMAGATLAARMHLAASELRPLCDATRAALRPLVALHRRAADRLQAECVFGALLQVRRNTPALEDAQLNAWGEDWLVQLGIAGGCGFFPYRARDGTPALALDRKVCCHDLRRHGGEQCSTCPKLPLDKRIARLLADPL